ncbi:hypothetical protein RRG08_003640 [Elysia crispata]|uniref:Choline transporter-like protein n=1 Tax=Elysia crispata TaxID=231223 RepID=A0AAE1AX60_9GAST|nr:hypothetical protein RRG08_003640 [Elysia crispata]
MSIFIAAFSVSEGDPFRLVYGYDSFGNTCDADNSGKVIPGVRYAGWNLKGKPYLFFMDIRDPDHSLRICVNTCPETFIEKAPVLYTVSQQTGSLLCRYDLSLSLYAFANRTVHGPCPVLPIYKSEPLLNRCVPTDLIHIENWLENNIANNIIAYLNKSNIFQKALRDLYESWNIIIALCFLAVAFSVVMVLIIRFLASVAVWFIVALSVLTSLVGTAFLWWTFMSNKNKLDREEREQIPLLEVDIFSENTFLTFSIIASVLTLMLLVSLVAVRRRLSLVSGLLQEAGSCVSAMPLLLMQPLWTFVLLLIFFIYWVTVLAFLCTAEKPTVTENGYVTYHEYEIVTHFWWYHLVGLFWVSEYIVACQSFVVSGAVGRWYFTRDKRQLGFPILGNIGRLIIFHQGSVALGSFIIPLLRFPRAVFLFVSKKLHRSETHCTCLGLRYLNADLYTVVAVGGKNFCTSAKKSYFILMANKLGLASIGSSAGFVLLLSKLIVMVGTASFSVFWFKSQKDFHFYAIPVLLVCVLSYFIAHCFISVYEMIVNALLLCFCEDRDLNDGSSERPYFGSRNLMARLSECSASLDGVTRNFTGGSSSTDPESEPAQV